MDSRAIDTVVPVDGKDYKITKVDARTGCWLFSFFGARSPDTGSIPEALGKCSREEFLDVQNIVLRNILFLDKKDDGTVFPTPILSGSGIITDESLKQADNLFKLTCEALMFNLSPFLSEKRKES